MWSRVHKEGYKACWQASQRTVTQEYGQVLCKLWWVKYRFVTIFSLFYKCSFNFPVRLNDLIELVHSTEFGKENLLGRMPRLKKSSRSTFHGNLYELYIASNTLLASELQAYSRQKVACIDILPTFLSGFCSFVLFTSLPLPFLALPFLSSSSFYLSCNVKKCKITSTCVLSVQNNMTKLNMSL